MTREEFRALLPQLVKNYKPAYEVLDRISNISTLMIVGPSGSGKTTLIQHLGLPYVPSDTTRVPRPEESDGVDYFFRSDYEKLYKDIEAGGFVQVAIGSGGDFYGTRASSYPSAGMGVMAVVADVIPMFRELGFKETITAFITPPSYEEWQRRIGSHNLSDEELNKRMSEARRSFSFAVNDPHTHLIINSKVDAATKQLKGLLAGHVDEDREEQARATAKQLLARLSNSPG